MSDKWALLMDQQNFRVRGPGKDVCLDFGLQRSSLLPYSCLCRVKLFSQIWSWFCVYHARVRELTVYCTLYINHNLFKSQGQTWWFFIQHLEQALRSSIPDFLERSILMLINTYACQEKRKIFKSRFCKCFQQCILGCQWNHEKLAEWGLI